MENSPFIKLYNQSKKSLLFQGLTKYVAPFGSNLILAILIFLLISLSNNYENKLPFFGIIFIIILLSALLTIIAENQELKKIRSEQKIYVSKFIQLHDQYTLAINDIKARDRFLSIISHELKTPLTVMLLNLHSLLKSVQNDSLASFSIAELVKILKNSEQQIKWITSMTNDLLDVSLITTGRMDLKLEDTDLVAITKQVMESFAEMLKQEKNKIRLQAKYSVVGKWDKVRIEQAITNLISNAIKYGEGIPIEIKVLKDGNLAKFIIKNHGPAIASHEQKVIFDLFKRASGSGEYKKGLGVGLFITSQVVKIHGGKIKVSSSSNQGTTFTIELPLKK